MDAFGRTSAALPEYVSTRARVLLNFTPFGTPPLEAREDSNLWRDARAIERRKHATQPALTYATVTNDRLRLRVDICPLAGKRITCSITGKASVIIDCIRYNKCLTFLTVVRSRNGIIKPSHP